MKSICSNRRRTCVFAVAAAVLTVLFIVSLETGKYDTGLYEVLCGQASARDLSVFYVLRLPRSMMAVLSGAALGLSGCVYQLIFKNPLASPDIIGVAGGANLGAAIAIAAVPACGMLSIASGAFAGGICAALCVLILARAAGGNRTVVYILAGVVINAVTAALIVMIKYFADPEGELAAIDYWEMGTLGNITMSKFLMILPFFAAAFAGIVFSGKSITLMTLEDDESRSLGLRLRPARITVLVLNTLLVSSVICLSGLIAFVGLVSPHIARLAVRRNDSMSAALSALVGAVTVTGADILARTCYSAELPISVFTTLIAVPVLVIFMIRYRRTAR